MGTVGLCRAFLQPRGGARVVATRRAGRRLTSGRGGLQPDESTTQPLSPRTPAPLNSTRTKTSCPCSAPGSAGAFPTDPQFRPGHPRFWTDINHNVLYQATESFLFVDGDPTTYIERRDLAGIFYTIDLGTQVPVERFVFFPPEGVSPESDEPFRPNYILKSYNLTAAKAETGIMQEELERGFVWRGDGPCCPLAIPLGYEERNADAVTEIAFPAQYLRFFRLIAIPDGFTLYGDPIVTRSAFAEMEIYGRGFAPQATYESQIIDLGREVNFGQVRLAVSKWRRDGEQLLLSDGPTPRPSGNPHGPRRQPNGLFRL